MITGYRCVIVLMMRLLSQRKFAEEAGVSQPAIVKAVKAGKLSIINGKIDADGSLTREYLQQRNDVKSGNVDNPDHASATYRQSANTPIAEGNSRATLDAMIKIEQRRKLQLSNAEKIGTLISRSMVDRCFQAVDSMLNRILRDGSKTIAATIHPLILAGATVEETEVSIMKEISTHVKSGKAQIKRLLQNDSK